MRSVSVGKISSINVDVDDEDDDDEGSIQATGKEILIGGLADEETLTSSSVADFEDSRGLVAGIESSGAIEEESMLMSEDDFSPMGVGRGGVEISVGVVEEAST